VFGEVDSYTACADGGKTKIQSKDVFDVMIGLDKFKQAKFFDHIKNLNDYNNFLIKDLNTEINTSHVLVIQYDGYIVNLHA
jgi:hypothetical protein